MTATISPSPSDVGGGRTGILHSLLRSPAAMLTAGVILAIVAVGLLAPLLEPHDPQRSVLDLVNAPPGGVYLLGGDASGRDIESRLMAAINSMMIFALIATTTAIVVGTGLGLIAGYVGGTVDSALSWVFDVIMAAPGIIVLIGIYAAFGSSSTNVSAVVFGVMMAVGSFRLARELVITVKHELYVDAARVSGLSTQRILRRHVLYVVRAPIIIQSSFAASTSIGVQAGLQFLGIGDPNVPSWGGMLQQAFLNLYINPLAILWPGLALTIIISSLVLFGNSLRDALEGPRSKRRRRRGKAARAPERVAVTQRATAPATTGGTTDALLVIDELSVTYPSGVDGIVTVVDGVSLEIRPGEILGLVGESGAGKSQTAFAVLGLLSPEARISSGSIKLAGQNIVGMSESDLSRIRGTVLGYIPQEPLSNLDPSFTVGNQLMYGIRAVTGVSRAQARKTVLDLLDRVGINDPLGMFGSYPHQISGGMAQRALIAGAVACNPQLLIADEPTTALDVTVQAEILDLIRDLQRERGMGVLLVTHNLGVVSDLCERVAVMHNGQIVEQGPVRSIINDPQDEYTKSLLGALITDSDVRADLVRPAAPTLRKLTR